MSKSLSPVEILAAIYRLPANADDTTTIWNLPEVHAVTGDGHAVGYVTHDGYTRFTITDTTGEVEETFYIRKRSNGSYQLVADEDY